ncbi:MAG: MraY family glycosyltransferase [Endomicrobiaceae bacterium]|nr:MraY family glycosyltransferase [Endomicrobiaceae bacterium]
MDYFKMTNEFLYSITFIIAYAISLILTPIFRYIAMNLNIYDRPITDVKTHKVSTPYLGGLAIWSGWIISLLIIRCITHFPTGTLNNIRSLLIGSFLLLLLGLFDDIKKGGLGFKFKFLIQIIACIVVVVVFDIRINFIENYTLSVVLSILWIIGLSNAFNIIDIMDGLSCGVATIASLFFFFIALPSEMIYVNFCAIALVGGCLGFLPYNLSKTKKIFMGDTGSLSIGFILATIAMGTSYTKINPIGMFAPLLILSVPIYETIFVSIIRVKKGKNPFLGSKDHFPLRLEKIGYTRKQILIFVYIACSILGIAAYLTVNLSQSLALILFTIIIIILIFFAIKLSKIKVD